MVGIGDALIVVNQTRESKTVINALIDDNFGKKWMSKNDSTYIPANKNFKISSINNELTIKEAKLIKNSLENLGLGPSISKEASPASYPINHSLEYSRIT